jgi:hypothetical protein
MKMFNLKLPRLRGNGVDGVAPRSQVSSESRVSNACRDTVAAWSELVSRTSKAELSAEGDIEVARLRFELALSVARNEPCADSSDACLKILLCRELEEWAGDEDQRVQFFQRQLFREISELLLSTHRDYSTGFNPNSACTSPDE